MKKRNKVYEHTAKLIKCSCCGVRMNELQAEKHNSRAMYKINNNEYLCARTKCSKSYMAQQFDRFENEGKNGNELDRQYEELKEKYGW